MAESTDIQNVPSGQGRLARLLSRRETWLGLAALALVAWAYADLLGLGKRYGFAKGVEYWLFKPSDSAPLVIILISAWLFYRRSPRVRSLSMASGAPLLALPFYLVCVATYGWAVYTGSLDMRVLSFTSLLFGTLALFWGRPGISALWLPAAFMLFALRIPAALQLSMLYELQMWTAKYAGWLLYSIGETAFVSGDQIIRANQKFQVVEGCSGMRSLETLTMLTILMADLFGRRGRHALLLVCSAPIVAFALNGVRVLTIVLNPHSDIATIHNAQGIAVLMFGLLIIYGFDEVLERALPASANPPFKAKRAAGEPRAGAAFIGLGVTAGLACVLLAIARFGPVWEPPRASGPRVFESVSAALAPWPSQKLQTDYNFLGSARFDQHFHHAYQLEEGIVEVFVVKGSQHEVGSSALSPMTIHPASGFEEIERLDDVELDGLPSMSARIMRRDKREVLVWHAWIGRDGLASETLRGVLALERSPLRRPTSPVIVRISTEIVGSGPEARDAAVKKLGRVRDQLAPALKRLAGVGDG